MYKIYLYKDKNGVEPVAEYMRPLRDRILFASWRGDGFVLLHQFMKKSQKTPKREIEKAKRELAELEERDG